MRYRSGTAFRTALEARINRSAEQDNSARVRLRKMVTFERLLARLLLVAPERWIVKGGVALDLRLGQVLAQIPPQQVVRPTAKSPAPIHNRYTDPRKSTEIAVAAN